jgi:hypothetical protein
VISAFKLNGVTSDAMLVKPGSRPSRICFNIFGVGIAVTCADREIFDWLSKGYGALVSPNRVASLNYAAGIQADGNFYLRTPEGTTLIAATDSQFLYNFEKHVTLALQDLRKDLYFIHGAVLSLAGQGCLLVASSGSGKSTTAWGALHHGFEYLSDELAPIDPEPKTIVPYPHAVCLKSKPPAPYKLPSGTLYTRHTIHIPTEDLPAVVQFKPVPLRAVFFVKYKPARNEPAIFPVSQAEAAARLYTNSLNQLAHDQGGLSAAVSICRNIAAFELFTTSHLELSIQVLRTTFSNL